MIDSMLGIGQCIEVFGKGTCRLIGTGYFPFAGLFLTLPSLGLLSEASTHDAATRTGTDSGRQQHGGLKRGRNDNVRLSRVTQGLFRSSSILCSTTTGGNSAFGNMERTNTMSKRTIAPPNTERKKAGNGVKRLVKCLLMTRRVLLLATQILQGVVKLMQVLKDIFGSP